MEEKEHIIVSFTSWEKRIKYVAHVVQIMKKQTLKPFKIILNLSTEEFPRKTLDLPSDLVSLIDDCFNINWVAKNTRVWKKFLPILDIYPNDVIIPIDDDIEYPLNYVEEMYKGYLKYNRECPIVCFKNIRKNNVLSHSGPFSLIKKDFFGGYLTDIYNNLICKHNEIHWQSDEVYSYAIWLNGKRYKPIDAIDGEMLYKTSTLNKIDSYSNYSKGFGELMAKIRELLSSYIKQKYNKEYDDLFCGEIIVNFTTWKKRDRIVPLMLEYFSKQTMKPNKIICWLSSEEYNNKVPNHLQDCINKGLLSEIRFVEGNTFAHKRWQTFKFNNDKYNIMIDDDIYYDINFVHDLYNSALKNQGCANIWCSNIDVFDGVNCKFDLNDKSLKSRKLQTLSGLSCYPPYTLSNIIFENEKLRNKWCAKCDDSWIRSCIIKDNIEIVRIYERKLKPFKNIENTQDVSVWQTENKMVNEFGVKKIYENFANALVCVGAVNEAKKIWPKFNIYGCCSKGLIDKDHKNNEKEVKNSFASKPIIKPKQLLYVDSMYNYEDTIQNKLTRRRVVSKKKSGTNASEKELALIYQRI